MFGRAALFLVMGMSSLFLVYTANMISTSNKTVTTFVNYYENNIAENMAVSAANMACNQIYTSVVTNTLVWTAGYNFTNFFDASSKAPTNTVVVTVQAIGLDTLIVTSTAQYMDSTRRVVIRLHSGRYSKYGAYYKSNSAQFATGDTLDGPTHFNTTLKTTGSPVFLGKVSTLSGLSASGSPANPKFLGGYDSGVNIDLTLNVTGMTTDAAGGYMFVGPSGKPFMNVDLTFNANGTVTYKTQSASTFAGISTATWSTPVTVALTTFAPNGLILVQQGNITMRGTLNGQVTVSALANGAAASSGSTYTPKTIGNVFIDNNIIYNNDPRLNPNSTDMLGVVAENSLTVTFNNTRGDITLMGSYLSQNDGLEIDQYPSYTSAHTMNIYGGVIATDVKATASYSNGIPVKGYSYSQKYDPRFLNANPPKFPMTNTYEVLSWNSFCPYCNW